jgi:hypothetical protein
MGMAQVGLGHPDIGKPLVDDARGTGKAECSDSELRCVPASSQAVAFAFEFEFSATLIYVPAH